MSDLLERLFACLGEVDTWRLLRALGGTRVEVPASARGSKLAALLGEAPAARLIEEIGPGRITLPMADERGQAGRRARAKKMLTEGMSARDVSRATDVHVRSVERYAQQLREDRQARLPFDD